MSQKIGLFSFFTGAGFLDLGFESEGFQTYMAMPITFLLVKLYAFGCKLKK